MASNPAFPVSHVTARLELRKYDEVDAEHVTGLIAANRDHLRRNFPELARGFSSVNGVQLFLKTCETQWNEGKGYHYGIWIKESHELIGQIKVKNIHWEIPSAELSYFIGQAFLRCGYATEVVAAVIEVAFRDLGFNRLYVRIISSNIGSVRLAQKLGMQHEGLHRNEFRCGFGELHDVHYYSLTPNDYALRLAGTADTAG